MSPQELKQHVILFELLELLEKICSRAALNPTDTKSLYDNAAKTFARLLKQVTDDLMAEKEEFDALSRVINHPIVIFTKSSEEMREIFTYSSLESRDSVLSADKILFLHHDNISYQVSPIDLTDEQYDAIKTCYSNETEHVDNFHRILRALTCDQPLTVRGLGSQVEETIPINYEMSEDLSKYCKLREIVSRNELSRLIADNDHLKDDLLEHRIIPAFSCYNHSFSSGILLGLGIIRLKEVDNSKHHNLIDLFYDAIVLYMKLNRPEGVSESKWAEIIDREKKSFFSDYIISAAAKMFNLNIILIRGVSNPIMDSNNNNDVRAKLVFVMLEEFQGLPRIALLTDTIPRNLEGIASDNIAKKISSVFCEKILQVRNPYELFPLFERFSNFFRPMIANSNRFKQCKFEGFFDQLNEYFQILCHVARINSTNTDGCKSMKELYSSFNALYNFSKIIKMEDKLKDVGGKSFGLNVITIRCIQYFSLFSKNIDHSQLQGFLKRVLNSLDNNLQAKPSSTIDFTLLLNILIDISSTQSKSSLFLINPETPRFFSFVVENAKGSSQIEFILQCIEFFSNICEDKSVSHIHDTITSAKLMEWFEFIKAQDNQDLVRRGMKLWFELVYKIFKSGAQLYKKPLLECVLFFRYDKPPQVIDFIETTDYSEAELNESLDKIIKEYSSEL
ncbi:hypothetical protein ADUPG1_007109, partial [Aduncisulcus paluster]